MTDLARYYDESYPPSLWNGGGAQPPTGVSPGAPGAFTPAGSQVPANLTALRALGPLGQTTAWIAGMYVVLGDASNANWDGTTNGWVAGIAAVAEEPESLTFEAIPVDRPEEQTEE